MLELLKKSFIDCEENWDIPYSHKHLWTTVTLTWPDVYSYIACNNCGKLQCFYEQEKAHDFITKLKLHELNHRVSKR